VPRPSLSRLSQAVLEREAQAAGARRIPLRIEFRMDKHSRTPGAVLGAVGGVWDLEARAWAPDPCREARVWYVSELQRETVVFFFAWLRAFVSGDWAAFREKHGARPFSLWTVGGRRRGKTWLGVRLLAAFCIACPSVKHPPWLVSPIETDFAPRKELHRFWVEALPPSWYEWVYSPREMYIQLVNGVRVMMYSAHDAEKLKDGAVGYCFWNEAQKSNGRLRALNNIRGGAADLGTLVHIAANPPREPDEYWIDEILEGLGRGEVEGRFYDFRGDNPYVVEEALDSMKAEMSERDYEIDRLGLRKPRTDIVLHRFVDGRAGNVRPRPHDGDVTEIMLKRKLGRPFAQYIGADFQRTPFQAACVERLYLDPDDSNDALSWTIDEVIAENADENDLIDGLEALGYRGDDLLRCLSCGNERVSHVVPSACARCGGTRFDLQLATAVIADASGAFQASDRKLTAQIGLKSFEVFRSRGWRHLYRPDASQKRNPLVDERVAVANERLCIGEGDHARRRAFIEPHCIHTIKAIKNWPNDKHRKPSRWSVFAHVGDAWTYPKHRLWPRDYVRKGPPARVQTIDIHGRDDRGWP
jgi:hypothetical protein